MSTVQHFRIPIEAKVEQIRKINRGISKETLTCRSVIPLFSSFVTIRLLICFWLVRMNVFNTELCHFFTTEECFSATEERCALQGHQRIRINSRRWNRFASSEFYVSRHNNAFGRAELLFHESCSQSTRADERSLFLSRPKLSGNFDLEHRWSGSTPSRKWRKTDFW